MNFIHLILHLDQYITVAVATYHNYFYLLLFIVVFCETGLVVTPFLPGDSLLLVTGSLAGTGILNLSILAIIIFFAAFLGDNTNFLIGKIIGEKLFKNPRSKIFRRDMLDKTHDFYERYGVKTIIIARFIPSMRTFAPFVAGIAGMRYFKFISFSSVASLLWVVVFLGGGFLFGNLPMVKNHFSLIIILIMIISLIPILKTIISEARNYNHKNHIKPNDPSAQ